MQCNYHCCTFSKLTSAIVLSRLVTTGGMSRKSDQHSVTVFQPTENKRSDERHGAWHLSPNATQLAHSVESWNSVTWFVVHDFALKRRNRWTHRAGREQWTTGKLPIVRPAAGIRCWRRLTTTARSVLTRALVKISCSSQHQLNFWSNYRQLQVIQQTTHFGDNSFSHTPGSSVVRYLKSERR